jgi:hypothetical protein
MLLFVFSKMCGSNSLPPYVHEPCPYLGFPHPALLSTRVNDALSHSPTLVAPPIPQLWQSWKHDVDTSHSSSISTSTPITHLVAWFSLIADPATAIHLARFGVGSPWPS